MPQMSKEYQAGTAQKLWYKAAAWWACRICGSDNTRPRPRDATNDLARRHTPCGCLRPPHHVLRGVGCRCGVHMGGILPPGGENSKLYSPHSVDLEAVRLPLRRIAPRRPGAWRALRISSSAAVSSST